MHPKGHSFLLVVIFNKKTSKNFFESDDLKITMYKNAVSNCIFYFTLLIKDIAAVSDLKIVFPKWITLKLASLNFAISSLENPPSDPIVNNKSFFVSKFKSKFWLSLISWATSFWLT